MSDTKKIRFLISRGSPIGGPIIRAGTVVDFPAFWADRFVADGTAELVEAKAKSEPAADDVPKPGPAKGSKPKAKGKNK